MKRLLKLRLLYTSLLLTGLIIVATGLIMTFSANEAAAGAIPVGNVVLARQVATSNDECVVCHQTHTPGIVNQYLASDHAQNNVSCSNCHLVDEGYAGAAQHPDAEYYVLRSSSTAMCETCHQQQVQQFNLSRHGLPAYVAYAGAEGLDEAQREMYAAISEGSVNFGRQRNSLHAMEGEAITRFACESCHNVGAPNADGSVGDCTACHLRHQFNLEQARKPETCNACHIGPDHPQWEIYQESPHGIAYATLGHEWHWEAEPGALTTEDFPAPTCATCHFSGFGLTGTTHDVGDRLTWFLAAPISDPRPNAAENRVRMQGICQTCHSDDFVERFYDEADAATLAVNDFVMASDLMMAELQENDLLTSTPFDEEIDFVGFELWHHWGRTTKFGTWMQGPDYTQWHGIYELLADMVELRDLVDEKLEAAGLEPLELPEGFPSHDAVVEYLNAQPESEE